MLFLSSYRTSSDDNFAVSQLVVRLRALRALGVYGTDGRDERKEQEPRGLGCQFPAAWTDPHDCRVGAKGNKQWLCQRHRLVKSACNLGVPLQLAACTLLAHYGAIAWQF